MIITKLNGKNKFGGRISVAIAMASAPKRRSSKKKAEPKASHTPLLDQENIDAGAPTGS